MILGRASAAGIELERPLVGGEHAVDGDVAIGVAVELDAGAMHALGPGVEIFLGLGDIAFVGRRNVR